MRRNEKQRFFSAKTFISLFVIFIMFTSVIAFMFGSDTEETFRDKGHVFTKQNNKFILKVEKQKIGFDYLPSDVEDIIINGAGINYFLQNKLEIDSTSSIDDRYAEIIAQSQFNLQQNLNKLSGTYLRIGTIKESKFNLPVITCKDANMNIPILYFKESNITQISSEEYCIILEGNSANNILRVKDRIMYEILEII